MFTIKIAGHRFAIRNHYDFIQEMARDYITDEPGEIEIEATDEEALYENQDNGIWGMGQLEARALHRKICAFLFERDTLLFHSVAVKKDGKAYLFTAPSGTGKSTHAMLWRRAFGDDVCIINGDTPLLEFRKDDIIVHGTPWCGKEGYNTNTSAPLAGVVILHQAPENTISPITTDDSFAKLLEQAFRSSFYTEKEMIHTMDLVERLSHMPVYTMGCTISEEAARMSHDILKKNDK